MDIYLFRHGIAEDGAPGSADAARVLTAEGHVKTREVVALARRAGARPSLILTSPYARARQTARIAADGLDYGGEVLTLESLTPHGAPIGVWSDILDHADERAVLLAGHEPLLSQMAAFLLNSPGLRVEMKKAAMVRVDVESFRGTPHGILKWMLTPRMGG